MVQEQILSGKSPGKSGDEVVFGSSPHSNTDIDKKSKIGSGNRTARSKSDVKMIKRKMSISIPQSDGPSTPPQNEAVHSENQSE